MHDSPLSADKLAELPAAHRDNREANRIQAAVLFATGPSPEEVAKVLRVDPNTVRKHVKRSSHGDLMTLGQVALSQQRAPPLQRSWRCWTRTFKRIAIKPRRLWPSG